MKKNKFIIHFILLSIPISIVVNYKFFDVFLKDFLIGYGGVFITIPFFYWFYLKFYGEPNMKGIILIQLEILLHFFYTMILLFYSFQQKNYLSVYYFLIYLGIYYSFKLAILTISKKTSLKTMKTHKILVLFLLSFSLIYGEDLQHTNSHELQENHQPSFDEVLTHHLMDSPIFELQIGGRKVYKGEPGFDEDPYRRYVFKDEKGLYKYEGGIPLHITKRVAMMWIVSLLLLIVFISAANKISKNPLKINGRFANLIEVLFNFVRHDIAESNLHHPSSFFLGYIITAFFFILFSNLLGLFPPFGEIAELIYSSITGHHPKHEEGELLSPLIAIWPGITVTGDIAVTFTLAAMTTILIWVAGFKYQGISFIWHAVPGGVPWWLYPIMWPIEFIISPIAKGFALMIRLLANMTAGHVVILVIASFIFEFSKWSLLAVLVSSLSVFGMSFMYVLELLVSFLQAFIFTLLSAIFIGLSMHRH